MNNLTEQLSAINWLSACGKIIGALAVLFIGFKITNVILNSITKALNLKKIGESLKGFIISTTSIILKVAVVLGAAAVVGFNIGALSSIIAASALAIGMALQGSLSNIAGGALIMFLEPFKVGDYIEAQGVEGVVKSIELFTTKITTTDNKQNIIPNGILSNGNIVNYSVEGKRRVDITIGVSYDADIKETRKVLLEVLNAFPGTLQDPKPVALVAELADSSVNFTTRTWVKTNDYWDAYFFIMENSKISLDKAGIEIPYPHSVEIHKEG